MRDVEFLDHDRVIFFRKRSVSLIVGAVNGLLVVEEQDETVFCLFLPNTKDSKEAGSLLFAVWKKRTGNFMHFDDGLFSIVGSLSWPPSAGLGNMAGWSFCFGSMSHELDSDADK